LGSQACARRAAAARLHPCSCRRAAGADQCCRRARWTGPQRRRLLGPDEAERAAQSISAREDGAVIRRTAVEPHRIAALADGGMSIKETLQDYPDLTAEQADASVAYARAHPKPGRPYPHSTVKAALRAGRGGLKRAFAAASDDEVSAPVWNKCFWEASAQPINGPADSEIGICRHRHPPDTGCGPGLRTTEGPLAGWDAVILENPCLAGGPGFEPRMPGSEPGVLPLNYPPKGPRAGAIPRRSRPRNVFCETYPKPFISRRRTAAFGLPPEPKSTSWLVTVRP
jgi:hypothetical protein